MTTFEPGRIYSVEDQDGQRHLAVYRDSGMFVFASGGGGSSEFARIRGPLVVLDVDDPADLIGGLREGYDNHCEWVADQIDEQTRPPLQVGWHEVKNLSTALYFDGREWRAGPRRAALSGDWTSTHYIGPASGDES